MNNHWITRRLTKPWELADRYLWFYDFDREELRRQSSKSLFALEGLWSDGLERYFNKEFESPASRYLARCDDLVDGELVEERAREITDPMDGLLLTLATRFGAAHGSSAARHHLEQLPDDAPVDQLLSRVAYRRLFRLMWA